MADAIPLLGGNNQMTVGMGLGGGGLDGLIKALQPILLGSGATNTGSTTNQTGSQTTSTTPDVTSLIQNLIGSITGANAGYTKDQAIADSSGAINGMIKQMIDANMPSVLQGGVNSGMYNDSTRTLLNNDLQSRMAGQAAQALQQQIAQYAAITNNNNQTAGNLASTLANSNRTSTTSQNGATNGTQRTTPIVGSSGSGNILAGLGGLAGMSLLRNGGNILSGLFGGSGGSDAASSVGGGLSGIFANTLGSGTAFGGGGDMGSILSNNLFTPNSTLPDVFGSSNIDMTSLLGNSGGVGGVLGSLGNIGSSIGSGIGNLASNLSSGFDSNSLSGLGDLFNNSKDWLSDAASGIGSFFGSLFANGGRVPMKKNYADGGMVVADTMPAAYYANGGEVSGDDTPKIDLTQMLAALMGRAGRPGGQAYDASSTNARMFDISRALWQQLIQGGLIPGGSNGGGNVNVSDNGGIATMDQLIAALKDIYGQQGGAQSGLQQALQGISQARAIGNNASTAADVITGAAPGSAASIASSLGGASTALSGAPISGAGSLGTVDSVGSMTGNAPFLPNAGTNSSGSGLFGGGSGMGAGSAAGSLAGASLGGAGSALAGGVGSGGLTAGLTSGTVDGLLGGLGGTGASAVGAGAGSVTGASGIFGAGEAAAGAGAGAGIGGEAGAAAGMGPAGLVIAAPLIATSLANMLDPEMTAGQHWQMLAQRFASDPRSVFGGTDANTLFGLGDYSKKGSDYDPLAQGFMQQFFGSGAQPATAESMKEGYQKAVDSIMQYQGDDNGAARPYMLEIAKGLVDNSDLWDTMQNGNITSAVNNVNRGNYGGGNFESRTSDYNDAVSQAVANAGGPQATGQNGSQLTFSNGYNANGGGNANGGMMPKQKGDPSGTADNMKINVSGGEYIMPKDVVDILGPQFFDNLVQQFHTPVDNRPPTKFGS